MRSSSKASRLEAFEEARVHVHVRVRVRMVAPYLAPAVRTERARELDVARRAIRPAQDPRDVRLTVRRDDRVRAAHVGRFALVYPEPDDIEIRREPRHRVRAPNARIDRTTPPRSCNRESRKDRWPSSDLLLFGLERRGPVHARRLP